MIFPGASEVFTDLGHLLVDGHIADLSCETLDAHDEDSAPAEHGCSGLDHHCRCCVTPPALTPTASVALEHDGAIERTPVLTTSDDDVRDGHREPSFRPPAT
jgi:hypothetical protein